VASSAAGAVNEPTWSGWIPKPVDTQDITLPPHLESLVELLADNAHANWGEQKLADKNPEAKKHPLLIPYDQLSADDQEYDRRLAVQTIKMILKLGYTIHRSAPQDAE